MTTRLPPDWYNESFGGTMNRKSRRSFVRKPRADEEHKLQCSVMNAAHAANPKIVFRAVPNGGLRNVRVAMRLKREGVKKGTYDTFVFIPPGDVLPAGGVGWLEMKSEDGRLTPEQVEFGKLCAAYGIPYAVASTFDEAWGVLAGWGVVPSGVEERARA